MRNPINEFLQLLVIFYRRCLSPLKPPCCRFEPTCSEYALQALRERGVCMGLVLTAWRIMRCHPFYHGPVYDPVPPKKGRKERGGAESSEE